MQENERITVASSEIKKLEGIELELIGRIKNTQQQQTKEFKTLTMALDAQQLPVKSRVSSKF